MPDDRFRWIKLAAVLALLAALVGFGVRRPSPPRYAIGGLRSVLADRARWTGREIALLSIRVAEVSPDGSFVGEAGGARATFRGFSGAVAGDQLALLVTVEPEQSVFHVTSAHRVVRSERPYRLITLGVSALTLAVVGLSALRQFARPGRRDAAVPGTPPPWPTS